MTERVGWVRRLLRSLCGPPADAPTSPLVVFDLEYSQGCLFIVLANTGMKPALDVKLDFDQPLPGLGGTRDFAKLPLFAGLPVLRPGREIRLFFDAGPPIGAVGRFVATARWSSPGGEEHCATYEHDTAIFRDWPELAACS